MCQNNYIFVNKSDTIRESPCIKFQYVYMYLTNLKFSTFLMTDYERRHHF
jgi:hypothetical protein